MKKVQVLLSAYNGEKYLAEQIESIMAQNYQAVSLLIRDDGSTDHTLDIIKKYADKYENIDFYTGDNLGVQKSFFHLMMHADKTADYYAFSDQDDVWLPEKIRRAVEMLEKQDGNRPLLYASETILVDEHLRKLPMYTKVSKTVPSFGNALVENICAGCTEVFNNQLLQLVNKKTPEYVVMHDWWLYLCASAFGNVCFDSKSFILYRQHLDNQLGAPSHIGNMWKRRVEGFRKLRHSLSRQAHSFINEYPDLCQKDNLAFAMARYKNHMGSRIGLVFSKEVHRQRRTDDMIYRGLLVLGLL